MDICHLKTSELEPKLQKYEGRVVLRDGIVKDDSGADAVYIVHKFIPPSDENSRREIRSGQGMEEARNNSSLAVWKHKETKIKSTH